MIIALAYLNSYLGSLVILSQILIVIFNLIILLFLWRKGKRFTKSHKNLDNIKRLHTRSCNRSQWNQKGSKRTFISNLVYCDKTKDA